MYTRPLRSIPKLIFNLKWHLMIYLAYLLGIYFAYEYLGHEQLDISMAIATVIGFSVALLLAFRTAASYDRWWEARKVWGAIVNDSRTMTRQLIGFTTGKEIIAEVKQMAFYQIAWCRALSQALRLLDPCEGLEDCLTKDELEHLKKKSNVHNEILKLMESKLAEIRSKDLIDQYQFVAIDDTLKRQCDAMGMCERIKNTVFPVQYRDYTTKGIMIFTLMLPYGMLFSTGPFMILICMVVFFFFYMIEDIAHYLQDPFRNKPSDIPMSAISRTIEINLKEMINEKSPQPLKPDADGILM